MAFNPRYSYLPVNRNGGTAETLVVTSPGYLRGFFPDATSTGSITIRDGQAILPAQVTGQGAAAVNGGSLAAQAWFVKIAAVTQAGVTMVGPVSAEATATTATTNLSINVTWSAVTGAQSYRVYIGPTTGTEDRYFTATASPLVISTLTGATLQTPAQSVNTNMIQTIATGLTTVGRDFFGIKVSGVTVQMGATADSGILVWEPTVS